MPDDYRIVFVTVDRCVLESANAINLSIIANLNIAYQPRVCDPNVLADGANSGSIFLRIVVDHSIKSADQLRSVAVKGQDIGDMSRQFIVDLYFTSARFV